MFSRVILILVSECNVFLSNIRSANVTNYFVARFEDFVATHEDFVHRQLHNKYTEIDQLCLNETKLLTAYVLHKCFYSIGTDEYKLISFSRKDVWADGVQLTYLFERRQKLENNYCNKIEYTVQLTKKRKGMVYTWQWKRYVAERKPNPQIVVQKPVSNDKSPSLVYPIMLLLGTSLLMIPSTTCVFYLIERFEQKTAARIAANGSVTGATPRAASTTKNMRTDQIETSTNSSEETAVTQEEDAKEAESPREETHKTEPNMEKENQITGFVDNAPRCPICNDSFKTATEVQTHWNQCLSLLFAHKKTDNVPEDYEHMYA